MRIAFAVVGLLSGGFALRLPDGEQQEDLAQLEVKSDAFADVDAETEADAE